ncbi:MAG TPA: DUF2071 domain-containing protein [Gemmataceae bacterium]|jgi:hypothetical protein|nr:DUF2071 domain-containing protein [Gemmataceae bacterium]
MNRSSRVFLTAEWRHLAMFNYVVDPDLLAPFVPAGTEIDFFGSRTFVSLVGFRFVDTRLFGMPIPFHRDFDEVNLRFYVRRRERTEWRRGVVFIKELVPRRAVATVARVLYNENYVTCPMRSVIAIPEGPEGRGSVEYAWQFAGEHRMRTAIRGLPTRATPGSIEEFIIEHYWGYVVQRDRSARQYRVEHPPWRVWPAESVRFDGDPTLCYGPEFGAILKGAPDSALVAEGSPISVRFGEPVS